MKIGLEGCERMSSTLKSYTHQPEGQSYPAKLGHHDRWCWQPCSNIAYSWVFQLGKLWLRNFPHSAIYLLIQAVFFSLSFCCCSVAKSCLTLCNLMDCSTPDSSVLHYLPEFAQFHVHWVGDAIQPSHLISTSCLVRQYLLPFSATGSFPYCKYE